MAAEGPGPLRAPAACRCFNGAAAGWPRKAAHRAHIAVRTVRFNGAAAGWPRKVPRPTPSLRRRPSFNGAAAGWPRKVRFAVIPVARQALLQWGRGRMAAEGGARGGEGNVAYRASMGPRPDGRGRWSARGGAARPLLASMGPRPDGRGRCAACLSSFYFPCASMGPRPDGRGRLQRPQVGCATSHRLQWGRGRMAAEGRRSALSPFAHGASMGPRPDGRGRP